MEACGAYSIRDVDGGLAVSAQVSGVQAVIFDRDDPSARLGQYLSLTRTVYYTIRTFRSILGHSLDRSES